MPKLSSLARRLRREESDAERLLWGRLRGRRLARLKFRRQVPLGQCTVDFACFERRLVVELDGGQGGEADQAAWDRARTVWLERQGFRVLRFWNGDVLTELDGVLGAIRQACERAD